MGLLVNRIKSSFLPSWSKINGVIVTQGFRYSASVQLDEKPYSLLVAHICGPMFHSSSTLIL